jgi:hypothetical protein
MNPYPLASLNHFTFPCVRIRNPPLVVRLDAHQKTAKAMIGFRG